MKVKRKSAKQKSEEMKKSYRSGKVIKDKSRTKEAMQKLRENNAEYKVTERKKDAENKKLRRSQSEYRENEKLKIVEYIKERRSQPELRKQEKEKAVEYMKMRRSQPGYNREQERGKTAQYMKLTRSQPGHNREQENEKKAEYIKRKRSDPEQRAIEQKKNTEAKQLKREDEDYRERERSSDLQNKKKRMDIDILASRQIFYNDLVRNQKSAELEFLRRRKCTPQLVCCCCEGTFFEHSVSNFNRQKVESKFRKDFFDSIFNIDSEHICRMCWKYVSKGRVPKLATSNGLKFVPVPECLGRLTSLEERMVAPFINFMQVRPLMYYVLNGQLGMKGSVVNIEVEINEMLGVLPRNFNQMQTIQVVLKRHILHKSDYMKETIRPSSVCEALKHLLTTPLYDKYNIQIDQEYLAEYENRIDEKIEFVVDNEDNKILQSEITGVIDDLDDEDDDEVLLLDRNKETVDDVKLMAPGQDKTPVAWHAVEDLEELSFPKIFCGHAVELARGISYSDRVKSESRRRDRRSCGPTRILYMAKKKLEKTCLANMNVCLRKQKSGAEIITKANALDEDYINKKIKFDEGYKILKQVRSSPAYWESKKRNLMAMIRQLGKPDVFLTFSAAEKKWPELLQVLSEFNMGKKLTIEGACLLDEKEKSLIIQKDPVTCARYFDYKANKFMAYLKHENSVFKDHPVEDTYERVEFQMRGSPHEHVFLWLRNAPRYDSTKPETNAECVAFVDSLMTCKYDPDDEMIAFQKHLHTHTCYKGLKNRKLKNCRFHYPRPVLPRTMILNPLFGDDILKRKSAEEDFKKIHNYMNYLYKKQVQICFEELLQKLDMDESRYVMALRSTIKDPQVFMKRSSLEVGINSYNRTLLHLLEANMDIQFVLNEYGLASYIINYIAKADAGLSKFIKRAAEDADCKNLGIREKFKTIINAFINCNLMSAQEASYHVLTLPLSKSSRVCVYINTSPIAERVRMLKMAKDLQKLMADSTDVFMENLMEKYAARPGNLEGVCLADFAACYTKTNATGGPEQDRNDDDEVVDDDRFRLRAKPAIIRYRRYKLQQDPANYYREQVLLFVPWRNEVEDVENANCNDIYVSKINVIDKNREKYSIIDEELIELAIDRVNEDCLAVVNEEIEDFEKQKLDSGQEVNILEQDGREVSKKTQLNRFVTPQRISEDEITEKLKNLNVGQKEFVMHVLHWLKTRQEPLRIFLSGSAGVGKSTVIKALYQSVTRHFDNLHGKTFDKLFVLLCAPSGKAAFLIGGVTLHTAFALPVTQFSDNMPELASDIANTIREKLMFIKLLIIDEISMVGSTIFSRVDTRLRQITGVNRSFGGISVICVGDLMQLPPVMDTVIYRMPKNHEMCELFGHNPLWEEFRYYELREIMRQKNEADFINALNNLAVGRMTDDDVKLIRSREKKETDVPTQAIYLYAENVNVDSFNEKKIEEHEAVEYISEADDKILGKVSESTKKSVLNALKKKKTNEVNGLPCIIRFKVGIKYMITSNIDVEDGLVNGACGLLELITFAPNTNDQPKLVWINFFNDTVGRKARLAHKNFMESNKIENHLVPVGKTPNVLNVSNKLQHQIVRTQFPLVPAMALTIHKSQGQTYQSVCIDFRKSRRSMRRQMLYVALSRVTSLSGLYILGSFRAPKAIDEEKDATLSELKKLKTEKKLTMCYDTLGTRTDSKIVIYQNVCSLKSKWDCITSDQWYGRGDVLIFAETLLKDFDGCPQLSNFKEMFRSNMSSAEKTRGLSCYVKSDLAQNDNIQIERTTDHSDKGHVELVNFQLNGFTVIAGYKSPQLSQLVFERCVRNLMTKQRTSSMACQKVVFLGDFNFNIHDQSSSFLQNLLEEFSLKSILPRECVTTDCNTQIDVVFSAIPSLRAGTYETYFSYHKPVFVVLGDEIDKAADTGFTSSQVGLENHEQGTNIVTTKMFKFRKVQSTRAQREKLLEQLMQCDIVKNQSIFETPVSIISVASESDTSQNMCQSSNNKTSNVNNLDAVSHPGRYLQDDHIEAFHGILVQSTNFRPQSPLLIQLPHMIERRKVGEPNLQILFEGEGSDKVGHWICVHYDGSVLNVYDSMNTDTLGFSCKKYIRCMYGDNEIRTTFHKVQQQTNMYDCGVFAIAFATSIAFGQDPSTLSYNIKLMRKHAAEMLTEKQLTPFPLQNTEPEVGIIGVYDTLSPMMVSSSSSDTSNSPPNLNASITISDALIDVVLNPKQHLLDDHMHEFNSILLKSTTFLPQTPLLWQIPEEIQRRDLRVANLQILFAGDDPTKVGHWICVHYDGFEMHVYDSLNRKSLHDSCKKYIRCMYGDNKMRTNFHSVQNQKNEYDCGVFAIAFATSIALGKDPSKLRYNIYLMREHVADILTRMELIPFPTIARPASDKSNKSQ